MKTCSKCKQAQPVSYFSKKKASSSGYKSHCKQCDKQLREQNRERDKELKHKHYLNNKEKYLKAHQTYNALHAGHIKEWKRNYRSTYEKQRYNNDVSHRLKCVLRSRLYQALQENQKTGSAVNDLGCSVEELKKHLESLWKPGMSWDNWSKDGWHIDHIRPLNSFDLSNSEEVKQACHYSNLQPLWAEENLQKSDKHNAHNLS